MFRRPSMIALRATREAHHVASDVAYPPMEAPPPAPVIPFIPETQGRFYQRRSRRLALMLAIIMGICLLAFAWYGLAPIE